MATLFDVRDDHYALSGLHQAHAAVSRGEVIVVPTDTVYGVAVCPKVEGAVDRVVALKGRGRDMAPPILVSSLDQAAGLVAEGALNDEVVSLIHQFWPGALTVVLPVNPELGFDIGHTPGTIALRSPDHPALLELLRIHGPLAVTSANRTGEPPCQSVYEAINVFGDGVSVYLDGGHDSDTAHKPSTIVDASAVTEGKRELRMIRQGAISVEQFADAGFSVVTP
jgi:L-threonylcarbamoyladenylate synthase